MCDCEHDSTDTESEGGSSTDYTLPTYVHHLGYDLKQSRVFLQRFGLFALAILETLKSGYSSKDCCVPALDTLKILNHYDDTTAQYRLTSDTIEPLVDKFMAYILNLLFPETRLRW